MNKIVNFNKSDLAFSISKKLDMPESIVLLCIENLISDITINVALGKNIEIRGFGTYKIVKRKARIGRNPKNSELVQIPKKKAIKWKISKTFFNRLNKNFAENKISDIH